jgi:hypothetical protein
MGMLKFVAPSLPIPTTTYSQDQQQQRDNALRLYFNQLDSAYWDGTKVVNPYGAWESLVPQTATANTATAVALEVVDYENSTSIASSSRMTVAYPGIYNLQWSAQILNSDFVARSLSVWLRKNGDADGVAGSTRNTLVQVGQANGAWNYYIQLAAADYIEIYWSTNNALVTLQTYAAQTTPTRPTTPSVIATLSFVSAIP